MSEWVRWEFWQSRNCIAACDCETSEDALRLAQTIIDASDIRILVIRGWSFEPVTTGVDTIAIGHIVCNGISRVNEREHTGVKASPGWVERGKLSRTESPDAVRCRVQTAGITASRTIVDVIEVPLRNAVSGTIGSADEDSTILDPE